MINELYIECSTCLGKIYFNLWSDPITLEILVPIALRCAFQFKLESIMSPKKLNSVTCSICILSMLIHNNASTQLLNKIQFIALSFNAINMR